MTKSSTYWGATNATWSLWLLFCSALTMTAKERSKFADKCCFGGKSLFLCKSDMAYKFRTKCGCDIWRHKISLYKFQIILKGRTIPHFLFLLKMCCIIALLISILCVLGLKICKNNSNTLFPEKHSNKHTIRIHNIYDINNSGKD